ncbi:MAG TPA: ESPR domain-containing protein, partial [Pseudoxanthomonas sp.]
MNHVFRIIWSHARNACVVVSELAINPGRAMAKRTPGPTRARDRKSMSLAAALLGAATAPAQAIDHYWDINNATAGAGGPTPSGIWATGGSTLSLNTAGTVAVTPRTTTTADRLFFAAGTDATGAYTVTVNGTQNIGRLSFQEGTVTLTGGTINFGAAAAIIDGDATPDSISSVLTGTNGVRFSGGTVILNGTAPNTYTGTTVVGGSGLAQATVILAASGGNAFSGNLVQMGGGGAYNTGGTVTLGAANQINDIATLSMTSTHYSGSSVFSLNGFDETIGGITLSKVGGASSVTFRNGAATDATVTLAGSGTYSTANGDRVFGRSITNGGVGRLHVVVALTGNGAQVFSGANVNYTGNTTINSGTLRLLNASTWASNATVNGGVLELQQNSAGTLNYAGAATRTHAN